MAASTERFNLTTFNTAEDALDYRDWKFSKADRILLDRLLTQAAERHVHIGESITLIGQPGPPPSVTYSTTGGIIPANASVFYRSAVVDERGQERIGSQTAAIITPPSVLAPDPPSPAATSGTLSPGDYNYAVTAYTNVSAQETTISRAVPTYLTGPGGFLLTLPRLPSGATGFNIYRKGPTDTEHRYMASTSDTTWTDDGSVSANPLRRLPVMNTTSSTNKIIATPVETLAAGQSFRVYRTYDPVNWDDSLLDWTATTPIVDTGHATNEGVPLEGDAAISAPSKIDLATETTGSLPPGATITHTQVTFTVAGPLTAAGYSPWQWVNEFDGAVLLVLRASLGRGSTPAGQPVIVGIDYRDHTASTWSRLRNSSASADIAVEIPVGMSSAAASVPSDAQPVTHLAPGDALRPVVLQTGGGATPTDYDLTVTVLLGLLQGPDTDSYTWDVP